MLGGRDVRSTIEKSLDKLHEDLSVKIDKKNPDRIHAAEASGAPGLPIMSARIRCRWTTGPRSRSC